jgi:hypothetical protein
MGLSIGIGHKLEMLVSCIGLLPFNFHFKVTNDIITKLQYSDLDHFFNFPSS